MPSKREPYFSFCIIRNFFSRQDSPADFELFDLLMEKSFTANFLHKYIESSLDSKHVGKILEMGKDMIISNGNDTYKCKRVCKFWTLVGENEPMPKICIQEHFSDNRLVINLDG